MKLVQNKFIKTLFVALIFTTSIQSTALAVSESQVPDVSKMTSKERTLYYKEFYMPIYQEVCEKYSIPLFMMLSISQHESRFEPWALNIAGKSYFPKSKNEALEIIRKNADKGFDVGLMQINKYWLKRWKIKVEDALDPYVNITLAGHIMNENFHTYGVNTKALGAYHTPPKNTERANSYVKLITQHMPKNYVK